MQSDIDEKADYDPIFAAGRGLVAALIAVAGVLFGNGILYLISQYGYQTAKSAGRSPLALFFFLLCIINVGNLFSYIPARTFATHAEKSRRFKSAPRNQFIQQLRRRYRHTARDS
jgi:hypothetical protein